MASRLQAVVQSSEKYAEWSVLKVDDLSIRPKTERKVQLTPSDWAIARVLQAWAKELTNRDGAPFLPQLATPQTSASGATQTSSQTPMKRSAPSDASSPVPEKKIFIKKRMLRTEEFTDDIKFVDYLGMVSSLKEYGCKHFF